MPKTNEDPFQYGVAYKPLFYDLEVPSFIDWPGHISAMVYTAVCNYACKVCHAPELVCGPFNELNMFPRSKIVSLVESLKEWIDAVVITGGEPTLHPELIDLVEDLLYRYYAVRIYTNGSRPEVIKDLVEMGRVSIVVDIKGPLTSDDYMRCAGVPDVEPVKETIGILLDSDIDYEFSTVVCRNLHSLDDIIKIASAIHGAPVYTLVRFKSSSHIFDEACSWQPYPDEVMYDLAKDIEARGYVKRCTVR